MTVRCKSMAIAAVTALAIAATTGQSPYRGYTSKPKCGQPGGNKAKKRAKEKAARRARWINRSKW